MDNGPLEDKEMVESSESFKDVYESHSKSIYKFLFWRTKDIQLSEDLTSSTFEKAWASRDNFHGGSVKAWLYRIARNVLIDHWRKKKELLVEDTDSLPADDQPTVGELLDKKLQIQVLRKALNRLPDDMRLIVTKRFIEGQSGRQIAKSLNLSQSNVRVMQYRALKKLKEYLNES
jgi:RNA polymerase sigma-70 factor (ECF subfamily)